jgi:hypothetical protein
MNTILQLDIKQQTCFGVEKYNIALGVESHNRAMSGVTSIGNHIISIGYRNFYRITRGDNHIAIGSASFWHGPNGSGDIGIGYETFRNLVSGSNLIAIGNQAANTLVNFDNAISNSIAFGFSSSLLQSGEVVFGGSSTGTGFVLVRPGTDAYTDLGSATHRWKDIYFSGTAYGTSSWAVSASWAPSTGGGGASLETGSTYPFTSSWAESASWAPSTGGTSLGTGSTYPITSSWSVTASYAENVKWLATGSTYPITSSWAVSSSYAPIPKIKAGIVSGSSFGGTTDLTASVAFDLPFVNNIYSVTVTGEDPRTWYVEFKDENGFIINSNSNVAFSGNVYWHAIYMGEYQ